MQFILPATITDSMIVSVSAADEALPTWSAPTTYPTGTQVLRPALRQIYERLAPGGVDASTPESAPTKWALVGASNSRRMFDGKVGTATTATDSITVSLAPGVGVRGLALLDMDGVETITVTMTTAVAGPVYSRTASALANTEPALDFYEWCFDAIVRRRVFILTDIPAYPDATITVTVAGAGEVSVGSLIVGQLFSLGDTAYGLTTGITDYSIKSKDAYGAYSIVERGYSRKATVPIEFRTGAYDAIDTRLIKARAQACVWIADSSYASLVIYGICTDWYLTLPGPAKSTGHLEIDGFV